MKTALCSLVLLACLTGRSQGLTLNAGSSRLEQFTYLPFIGVSTDPVPPGSSFGLFQFNLSGYDTNTDSIYFEMYENTPSDTPLWKSSLGTPGVLKGGAPGWKDLQGWVRLDVINGSVTLDSIKFDVYVPIDAISWNHYGAVIPVPEPSPFANFGVETAAFLLWNCLRKNR